MLIKTNLRSLVIRKSGDRARVVDLNNNSFVLLEGVVYLQIFWWSS